MLSEINRPSPHINSSSRPDYPSASTSFECLFYCVVAIRYCFLLVVLMCNAYVLAAYSDPAGPLSIVYG